MNPALPLLLLLLEAQGPEEAERALSGPERRTIQRFSATWSVEFRPFRPLPATRAPSTFPESPEAEATVRRIEELLDAARQASARLDEPDALRALEDARHLLAMHPELPQAAWLRAELFTIDAERIEASSSGGTSARAAEVAELRQRARALEGPRALPFQERTASLTEPEHEASRAVILSGPDPRDQVEWNGVQLRAPFQVNASPGEHALRVFRRGALLLARWVTIDSSAAPRVDVNVPAILPCSPEDLSDTALGQTAPRTSPGVLCPRWAVARRERGALELALCRHSTCGSWQHLEPEHTGTDRQTKSTSFPTWARIALAGAGTALATSFVLWQTGVFDTRPSTRERWTYGGFSPSTE